MDLDKEELDATNPDPKDLEIKLLKAEVKQLKTELQFYKEVYYGKENDLN